MFILNSPPKGSEADSHIDTPYPRRALRAILLPVLHRLASGLSPQPVFQSQGPSIFLGQGLFIRGYQPPRLLPYSKDSCPSSQTLVRVSGSRRHLGITLARQDSHQASPTNSCSHWPFSISRHTPSWTGSEPLNPTAKPHQPLKHFIEFPKVKLCDAIDSYLTPGFILASFSR